MKKIGLFPGSFDPFTKGHHAVVRKSLELFDEVIIGIGINSSKNYLFELEKRKAHIRSHFVNNEAIRIEIYQKLTVDFCKEIAADFIIRGLRDAKDFEYEKNRLINYISQTQQLGEGYFDQKESHSFGKLNKTEWNNMFYKHLDHHLKQFGV